MQEGLDPKGKGKSKEEALSKVDQQSHRKTFGPDAILTSDDALPRMSIVQE